MVWRQWCGLQSRWADAREGVQPGNVRALGKVALEPVRKALAGPCCSDSWHLHIPDIPGRETGLAQREKGPHGAESRRRSLLAAASAGDRNVCLGVNLSGSDVVGSTACLNQGMQSCSWIIPPDLLWAHYTHTPTLPPTSAS